MLRESYFENSFAISKIPPEISILLDFIATFKMMLFEKFVRNMIFSFTINH
ncbi:hypothetical protein BGP_4754 [Beggiatoa sp. PS]|nr:hypothetical protein BGP_4754 [Beggiatoa sp. PS]